MGLGFRHGLQSYGSSPSTCFATEHWGCPPRGGARHDSAHYCVPVDSLPMSLLGEDPALWPATFLMTTNWSPSQPAPLPRLCSLRCAPATHCSWLHGVCSCAPFSPVSPILDPRPWWTPTYLEAVPRPAKTSCLPCLLHIHLSGDELFGW